MFKDIVFTNTLKGSVSDLYKPVPASSVLPEWYKKTDSYIGNKKIVSDKYNTVQTIKKCIPVFDILTAGYIITTYCDLWIKRGPSGNIMYLTSSDQEIEQHDVSQAPYHPNVNGHPFPKWINPWAIKTPKGYSCLIIPPVHNLNPFFTILEGFVDTDNYNAGINFPFVLNDINFEGLIPAGTPMAQIIPIKRDSWKIKYGKEKNLLEHKNNMLQLASQFFDRYKTMFWVKKEFK